MAGGERGADTHAPPIAWGHVGPWGPYAPRWRARQRDRGVPPLRPGRDPSFTLISHSVAPGPVVTRSLTRVAVGESMTCWGPLTTLPSACRSRNVSSESRVRLNQPSGRGSLRAALSPAPRRGYGSIYRCGHSGAARAWRDVGHVQRKPRELPPLIPRSVGDRSLLAALVRALRGVRISQTTHYGPARTPIRGL